MNDTTIQRVWRETVASYGPDGINRPEAVEAATATLMVEVRAGRLEVDIESALRSQVIRADERDGRAADQIIWRAAHGGSIPLVADDLDVVVTLGAGKRKAWRDVTREDLDLMVEVRYENYRKVRTAFESFNESVALIRRTVADHGTVGAAFDAGGFPPARAEERVA